MVYSDYDNTNLSEKTFDIVILNGSVDFENSYAVIKEVERVTKDNGMIICCTSNNYLLESTFKLIFAERDEYTLNPFDMIMTTRKDNNS